ncbi:MAG: hypothetical protein FJX77_11555, partial [Armatimonadetes bacterium]|nr:hypothetical protein [Armatimonadota bacterium]
MYGGSDAPLEALRREGYAVLHPAFPEPWLQETRSYIEELYRSARARAESCGDESMEWREENGILVTLDRWRTFGRFRFLMPEDPEHRSRLPKPIQEYMRLPVARRIIESYYGCAVTPCRPYTMAEVLTPCPRVEEWHVDCLRPGVKAFLYLSDCAIEQGPLRYIPGTHLPDEQMHHRLYRVGRSGLTEAYFAEATNREFDQKGLSLTGKA